MALLLKNFLSHQQHSKLKLHVLWTSQCFVHAYHPTVHQYMFDPKKHRILCIGKLQWENPASIQKLLTSRAFLSSYDCFSCHEMKSQQIRCQVSNVQGLFVSRNCLSKLRQISIRHLHNGSQMLVKNPLFPDFMKTLIDEFTQLSQDQATEKLDEPRSLRLQFLRPVVAVLEKIRAKEDEKSELINLFTEEGDKDMKSLLEKEIEQLSHDISEIEDELVDALVGEEAADSNDIVLEISAGVGGQEAMLFSAEVFEMYCNYAICKGWSVSEVSQDESEMGGFRKASMQISGEEVYRHLKHEGGVHRVQRIPKTEKSSRMHTSTITVAVLPKPREIDIVLDPKDLKVETMRGSGPGGQSVNTTDSAVRITHLPTGTVAECKQERSQIKNRDIALDKLKMRMYQAKLDEQEAKRKATRKMQMGTRGRSEKIRTYNFQQDRISDHRLKGNINNIQEFMRGGEELDDLISSLEMEERHSFVQSMLDDFELSLKEKSRKS